jgi:hypothetical protein
VQYPAGWTPTGEEYDVETDVYLGLSYTREDKRSGSKPTK